MAVAIYIDVDQREQVDPITKATATLAPITQGEVVPVNLFFVTLVSGVYSYLDLSSYGIRVGIAGGSGKPSGNPPTSLITLSTSWTAITSPSVGVYGVLDLTSDLVGDFIGALAGKETTLEVEVTPPGGNKQKVLQQDISILRAAVIAVTPNPITPGLVYVTQDNIAAILANTVISSLVFSTNNTSIQKILSVPDANRDGAWQDIDL